MNRINSSRVAARSSMLKPNLVNFMTSQQEHKFMRRNTIMSRKLKDLKLNNHTGNHSYGSENSDCIKEEDKNKLKYIQAALDI